MKTHRTGNALLWITMIVIALLIVAAVLYFRVRIKEIDSRLNQITIQRV